jgi:hypothetical protein
LKKNDSLASVDSDGFPNFLATLNTYDEAAYAPTVAYADEPENDYYRPVPSTKARVHEARGVLKRPASCFKKPAAAAKADEGLVFGCSKCRYAARGCARCRKA